ncbi:MAG TPA: aminoglycoside phosphotransferase family protein [Vicinamibacterales bacterium]|jgi:aminoglycoside phosphotransferase (APT) family kinase protein
MDVDPVDDILTRHGIRGPWEPLTWTGVANRIYATRDAVLRIATDHAEAVEDARTESVAAPIARAAGVLVPQLVAFDDSRTLVDRPYSIWERVHGETLGLMPTDSARDRESWHAVGRQLAMLHTRVRECPDPNGWLDRPGRDMNLASRTAALVASGRIGAATAAEIEPLIAALTPAIAERTDRLFLHNDIHGMNVMCRSNGSLLAILDWGDAGWGDPALEFAQIPLRAVPWAIAGYESEAGKALGDRGAARIIWDKLGYALDAVQADGRAIDAFIDSIRHADEPWRRAIISS